MSDFYVNVFQTRDTSFQIGVLTGRMIRNTLIVWKELTKQGMDHDNMKSIYETYAPNLLEELEGLASPDYYDSIFSLVQPEEAVSISRV
ncbi:hypothetical protein [Pontibacillus yanchengensis]|uniref:hypothetical protein n=1 Tax=Pontibacillus yanchengensis TaxID=462910 RepID=UPI001F3D71F7|nr:hypothetical protein [Pontibacillus yanchengensis]